MPPRQKKHKSMESMESSDHEDASLGTQMPNQPDRISSPTLTGGDSFLRDSIDHELDEEMSEPLPENAQRQPVETSTASKAKKVHIWTNPTCTVVSMTDTNFANCSQEFSAS